jgi:hypothetical protein
VLGLALALTTGAAARPLELTHAAKAKKCFKRKHGKRVRVKCPKPAPKKPKPAAPAPPPLDPALKQEAIAAFSGHLLHHFSTSAGPGAFQGEELLHLCSDGHYKYLAQFYLAPGGLFGAITDQLGGWQVTGAQAGPDGTTTAGLLLRPADGTAPHFEVVSLAPTPDGLTASIAGARWYLGPSTLCA